MRDSEYYDYRSPSFEGPKPVVQHGVLLDNHDGVWLHSASHTAEFVIANLLAQYPKLEYTELGEVPDTYVPPQELMDSTLEKEVFTLNAPQITLPEFVQLLTDGRVFAMNVFFIQEESYVRLVLIPESIPNPEAIDRSESRVYLDEDRDPAFRLVDDSGQPAGVTTKLYLVGPDANEVIRLLRRSQQI